MKKTIAMTLFLMGLGMSVKSIAQNKLDVFNDATCSVSFTFLEDANGTCPLPIGNSIPAGPGQTQRYGTGGTNYIYSVTVTGTCGGTPPPNLTVEDCNVTSCASCTSTNLSGTICICGITYIVDFTPATAGVNASVWIH